MIDDVHEQTSKKIQRSHKIEPNIHEPRANRMRLMCQYCFSVPVTSLTIAKGITRPETSKSASAKEKRNQLVRFCNRRSVAIARQTNRFPKTPIMEKNDRKRAGQ